MRDKFPVLSALLLLLIFIGACGGTSHTVRNTEVPVVVSISDQPPAIGVLSFDVQITGACLLNSANAMATSCDGAQNLLPQAPMNVQLANMQTLLQGDVLATTNLQPDSYTALLITFGTVSFTVNVSPDSTYGDGTTSCSAGAAPTACELSPALTANFVSLPLPNPVTLVAGQPTHVAIEFNVADSLGGTIAGSNITFTITPAIGSTIGTGAAGTDGNLIDVTGVTGPVTALNKGTFTVTDSATGQLVTLTTGIGTTFSGFSGCNNKLACVQVGQLLTVNYGVSNTSTPTLTAASITNNAGFSPASAFVGTVVATTPTPMVVVTSVPAGNSQVTVGQVLTLVPPTAASSFSVVVPSGQTLPVGVSFASSADLLAGQNVLIDATGVDEGVATSDAIALEPSQFGGTLDVLTKPNLTVNGLNNFFTDHGISIIQVLTGSQTTFAGTVAMTGFDGLAPGDAAQFSGFLFNGAEGQPPVVFAETVFDNGPATDVVKRTNR